MSEFYVGYLPKAPAGIARRIRLAVGLLFAIAVIGGLTFACVQRTYAPAVFEYGKERNFEGVLEVRHVPVDGADRRAQPPGRLEAGAIGGQISGAEVQRLDEVEPVLDAHGEAGAAQQVPQRAALRLQLLLLHPQVGEPFHLVACLRLGIDHEVGAAELLERALRLRQLAAIDEAGWMHTGDVGILRDDGYAQIVGRIKDMIIRGGENISPREIEEFLYTHPAVSQVSVIGIPDPTYGEEVCAWVSLKEGATVTEEEIRQFCKGQIATYKIPRVIRFTREFPMTASGKIQKFRLRELTAGQ